MSTQSILNHSAVISHLKAHPMTITSSPIPTPIDSEVLIRVHAVAINPADWAVQTLGIIVKPECYPYVNGIDVSGQIVSTGPLQTRFKPGDRVLASAAAYRLGENKYGAFQEYMIGVEPLMAKIPDRISYKQAAVLPLGLTTASTMLFSPELMGLDLPKAGIQVNSKANIVVIWGGSSSVGANAIQAVKAAGYIVASTASERNHDLLREIGVDYVFDYKRKDIVAEIVNVLGSKSDLAGIYDAIFTEDTIRTCAEIASQLKGRKTVGTVLPPGMPLPSNMPEGVELLINSTVRLNETDTGKSIWVDWVAGALEDGSLKCKPDPEVVGDGLEKLQVAVDRIGKGVSAKKLVVEIQK